MNASYLLVTGAAAKPRRPVRWPWPPLPPFPAGNYLKELPWTPPASRDFLRADAWGVRLPGLPPIPGGSREHPERVLTWFFDVWSREWQLRVLEEHAKRGYTHFILSAADALARGVSLSALRAECDDIKAYGFYVVMFLGSKDYWPRDMSYTEWLGRIVPIMSALDGAVDEYVVAWEWDLWNTGATGIPVAKAVGQRAHAQGASCWLHFSSHVTWWMDNGNRFIFWDTLGRDVDGLMYQTYPQWGLDELQARLVDTLWQFGVGGNIHKLRLYEDSAALEFTHDHPDENDAALRSYVGCCAIDNVRHTTARVWGYGNGGRRPDGSAL